MMKPSTKAIVTMTAMLIGVGAYAGPMGHAGGPDARLERMNERLDLTSTQQDELRAVFEAHHEEVARLRSEMQQQIDSVLTESQREARANHRSERMEHRLGRMSERLDLNEQQRDEVRAIFEERQSNPDLTRDEVRERIAAVLTPEQQERMAQSRRHKGRHGGGRGWHQSPTGH